MKYYFARSANNANAGKFEEIEADSRLEAMGKANDKIARTIDNFYAWFERSDNRFYAATGAWD